MATVEFVPWPKIARLNREIIVTEKIDGTNAAIVIKPLAEMDHILGEPTFHEDRIRFFDGDANNLTAFVKDHAVFVQSRKRFIVPGRDNYGFAAWVREHAEALVDVLGPGAHYGEWWGKGIQRGYGMDHRVFSLFNTTRWGDKYDMLERGVDGLSVVPVLYSGNFNSTWIDIALESLGKSGSYAAWDAGVRTLPEAEGIVVYHTAANTSFKVTLRDDEAPKGAAGHALDEG